MTLKKTLTLLILTVLAAISKAQDYPKDYFIPPLDPPLIVVGTFGEIRNDHFHMGIDLSTDEAEDKNVYAAADGYVSRIKVSNGGYGKALYITHPNGFVTVYGHLNRFGNDVQHAVTKLQYEQQKYEVEIFPKGKEFKVLKGDLIGLSGNTGDAEGPHLHFEIRDEKTEDPLNPLLFGLGIYDLEPPAIYKIRLFPFPGQGIVNNTDTPVTLMVMRGDTGISLMVSGEEIYAYGPVGFAVEVSDYFQNSTAVLGNYSVQLKVDTVVVDEFQMDRLSFKDNRCSNAHIDYLSKVRENHVFQRSFRLPGNPLKIYGDYPEKGYVTFSDNESHLLEYTVKDYFGNFTTLKFTVIGNPELSKKPFQPAPKGTTFISNTKGINIQQPNVEITIPSGTVYDGSYFSASESPLGDDMIAPIYHVGNRFDAVHSSYSLGIKPMVLSDSMKSKAVIVSIEENGDPVYEGGTWNKDFLTAQVRRFGDFTVAIDTTAPTIVKEYYPTDMNNARGATVQFVIRDNLSGIKSYTAKVDGKWLLMEYKKRDSVISGDISSLPINQNHEIEVRVTDEKGNEAVLTETFFY